jgi:hypothetical protein
VKTRKPNLIIGNKNQREIDYLVPRKSFYYYPRKIKIKREEKIRKTEEMEHNGRKRDE